MKFVPMIMASGLILGGCAVTAAPTAPDVPSVSADTPAAVAAPTYHVMAGGGGNKPAAGGGGGNKPAAGGGGGGGGGGVKPVAGGGGGKKPAGAAHCPAEPGALLPPT
jgi:hypothetical protein